MAAIEILRPQNDDRSPLNFVHNDEQYGFMLRYIALLRSTIASNAPLAGMAVQAATAGAAAAAAAFAACFRLGDTLRTSFAISELAPHLNPRTVPLELPFALTHVFAPCMVPRAHVLLFLRNKL